MFFYRGGSTVSSSQLRWLALAIGITAFCLRTGWSRGVGNGESTNAKDDTSILSLITDHERATCIRDHRSAFDQHAGSVQIIDSPTQHPVLPKLSFTNTTAWEQWLFDGTSTSVDSAILINFTRDPSYHFFRQGNLRVEIFLMLDGRLVLQDLDFVDDSTVLTCTDSIVGIWIGKGRTYRFDVPRDVRSATVHWETKRHRGSAEFASASTSILGREVTSTSPGSSTPRLTPAFSLMHPIAGGPMNVTYTTRSRHTTGSGQNINFTGTGGHTRTWATHGWFDFAAGFNQVRAVIGPYVLTFWRHTSREASIAGQEIFSAQLFKDGELLASTNLPGSAADLVGGEDRVIFEPLTTAGSTTGSGAPPLSSRITGRTITFHSPTQNKTWQFTATHHQKFFDMALGPDGIGIGGFTANFVGGEIDKKKDASERYEGSGFVEQTAFPTEFKQWQIWAVYAVHSVGNWWKQAQDFIF